MFVRALDGSYINVNCVDFIEISIYANRCYDVKAHIRTITKDLYSVNIENIYDENEKKQARKNCQAWLDDFISGEINRKEKNYIIKELRRHDG